MKVLHVIPAVAPRYGGPSQAVVGMGRALTRYGLNVQIATTDADGPARLSVQYDAAMDWRGVPAIFFPRQWSEGFKYSRPLADWLASNVDHYDVVHIHAVFSHACLAAATACRTRHVPYIVRPLGTLDPWSMQQKPLRKRLLWHLGVKRMLDGAAAIHYTTASEQRLAESTLKLQNGVVIPIGVDDELFHNEAGSQLARNGGDPYILVLGRLHPKKGLELFLDVFLRTVRSTEFRRWRLIVAGSGSDDYVAKLKRIVSQSGGEEHVTFSGWLEGQAKSAALRRAELLALPSRQENFGIVVAEALACGTPVLISTHVNLADEVAAANAGWVVPLETAPMMDTMSQVLRDGVERQRRGVAGQDFARACFSWSSVAGDLGSLYSSISRN